VHLRSEHAAGRLDSRTAVAVLGHDPRFDLAVLDQALRMDLAYVGAMGSRTTHGRRAEDLLRGGLPEGLLSRLHSPIGLDIGALTPEEVAVAILAEIIATRRGRDRAVHPLRDTAGPVHAPRGMDTAPASWKVHPRWT
jgi:xanthine dehydrogenase accessory factor